jgi:hypothetical protein
MIENITVLCRILHHLIDEIDPLVDITSCSAEKAVLKVTCEEMNALVESIETIINIQQSK